MYTLERLVRLEVEKLAFTSGRHAENRGSGFDLGRARRIMPVFEEDAVDILFEMFEKVAKESEGGSCSRLSVGSGV